MEMSLLTVFLLPSSFYVYLSAGENWNYNIKIEITILKLKLKLKSVKVFNKFCCF